MSSQSPATTRLHITPLSPELLPLVVPASIRSFATDVSFHDIPTFPENNFGYVTLPTMEADKIKKKLNGSILKGRKFKVESARAQKQQNDDVDRRNSASSNQSSLAKKVKKRKAGDDVLDGYELPSHRKVKRGWTESSNDKTERRKKEKRAKDKEKVKSQPKSKYTEKAECLFRTTVPPNKFVSVDGKSEKQPKSKASPGSVVHEFSQTMTHPTFLRSNDKGNPLTSTFEEGKGWLDEFGNLKEPASGRARKEHYRPGQIAGHKEKPKQAKSRSHIQTKSRKDKSERDSTEFKPAESTESEDWTSSSGSSSESDITDSESDEAVTSNESEISGEPESSVVSYAQEEQHQLAASRSSEDEQESSAEPKALTKETSAETNIQQQPTEVHPLEALFKKPTNQNKPDAEPPAQFSFFGQEDADSEEEASGDIAPLTPFTKRDLQDRGLRSAAPTPDTSQVTRTLNWDPPEHSDILEEAYLDTDSPVPRSATGSKEESDFAKWFWENRGDNNRAWKKRRRDVAKEQRQRENRRKGMKGKS
ncbi:hypothetical protein BDW62DRAFT_193157 [Aspergillus aurantiobrunneus]